MDTEKGKLIEKIAKLLALGEGGRGATEAEALLAVSKAKELMARHHIHMADVERESQAQSKTKRSREFKSGIGKQTRSRPSIPQFEQWIAAAVAELTSTKCFFRRGFKTFDICYFGDEDDAAIATALFPIFQKMAWSLARQACGKGWTPSHRSFAEGFAIAVLDRAREEAKGLTPQETECVALVLRDKNALVEKAFADAFPKMRSNNRKATGRVDYEAYRKGEKKGREVSLAHRNTIQHKEG